jgi:hypothetical protein
MTQRRAPLPAWTPEDGTNPYHWIIATAARLRAQRQAEQGSREALRQLADLERRRHASEHPDEP